MEKQSGSIATQEFLLDFNKQCARVSFRKRAYLLQKAYEAILKNEIQAAENIIFLPELINLIEKWGKTVKQETRILEIFCFSEGKKVHKIERSRKQVFGMLLKARGNRRKTEPSAKSKDFVGKEAVALVTERTPQKRVSGMSSKPE